MRLNDDCTEITNRLLALKQPNAGLAFRIRNYRYNNAVLQRLPKSLRSPYRDLMIKAKLLEAPIFPYEQNGQQAKAYTTNNFINYFFNNRVSSVLNDDHALIVDFRSDVIINICNLCKRRQYINLRNRSRGRQYP